MRNALVRVDNPLKRMYEQVSTVDLESLLAGLTILTKDTATYLATSGIEGSTAEGFRMAYLDMLGHNRYYWERFGPQLFQPLQEAGLPEGFARAAANCKADLSPLLDCDLKKPWLHAPGWHFFQTFGPQCRLQILCGKSLEEFRDIYYQGIDPCSPASNNSGDTRDPFKPVAAMVERLAGNERPLNNFWYPVMLYLVLLLHKTNFVVLE